MSKTTGARQKRERRRERRRRRRRGGLRLLPSLMREPVKEREREREREREINHNDNTKPDQGPRSILIKSERNYKSHMCKNYTWLSGTRSCSLGIVLKKQPYWLRKGWSDFV
jgi:hypothetical protein